MTNRKLEDPVSTASSEESLATPADAPDDHIGLGGLGVDATLGLDRTTTANHKRWRIVVVSLVLLLLVTAAVSWLGFGSGTEVQYRTADIQRGNLTVLVTATGNLEPTNQVDVGIEVSGTVATVEVDYNDQVVIGQVLASLDATGLEAQVLQATATLHSSEADVAQAEATVHETKLERDRLLEIREMSDGTQPSQTELDAAEASLARALAEKDSADAAVIQAGATLKMAETDLSKAVIHSPINGIVLERNVEPGQTVAATLESPVLFVIAEDLAQMELHVDVDEADVGQVQDGQSVSFTVDAYPDRSFPARVIQVRYGPQEVDGVITYKTVLNVDNADHSLRPGMTATADIVVEQVDDSILVPNSALRFTPTTNPAPAAEDAGGGLLESLLPRPSRGNSNINSNSGDRQSTPAESQENQNVWIISNEQPKMIEITAGVSDGINTEVLNSPLRVGDKVIIEMIVGTP